MKFLKNILKYWVLIILILQPILDIIAYFTFNSFITPISFVSRTLILFFIVFYTFIKVKDKKKFILCLIPFILFCFLHIFNSYRVGYMSIFSDIRYLILVFQMPVITICLINYIKNYKEYEYQFKVAFVINVIIIFISFILSIIMGNYNYTYENYGITGWFTSENAQSMILVAICPIFLYYFTRSHNIIYYILGHIIIILLLFLNGTKACYITLIISVLSMLYITIVNCKYKERILKSLISILCLLFVIFYTRNSSTFKRLDSVDSNTSETLNEVKENVGDIDFDNLTDEEIKKVLNFGSYWKELIEIYGEDIVVEKMRPHMNPYSLTDNRLRKKIYAEIIYDNSDLLTHFLGFEFTKIGTYEMDLENDLTAIYYYYGYIGFAIYIIFILYFVWLLFKMFIKNPKIIFDGEFIIYCVTFALILFGSEYTGAFLRKSNANIYLSILFVLIYLKYIKNYKNNSLNDSEITIMALHLNYGGVEKYISSLCNMLDKKYKINIICTYKIDSKPAFNFSNRVNITYLLDGSPNKEKLKLALRNKDILSIIKEGFKSVKILFLKKYRNIKAIKDINSKYIITTRYFHNYLVGTYAKKDIIKIATEHNSPNDKKYINKLIESINYFDYFVLVSKNLKDFYETKVKPRCVYIPNVIDSMPNIETDLKENIIINIGRLEDEKKQEDLIDIVKIVKEKISDIKLFIIGDGSLKNNLLKKIKDNNLEKQIILTGFLNKKEMEEYLKKAKLFVMTSKSESFGLVLIEAMSYKVPCIAFQSASGPSEILSNDVGILIDNRDKINMSNEIIRLLKNDKLLKEYSLKGYEKSKEYLSSNVKNMWFDLLK